jgi:hypothetical protein
MTEHVRWLGEPHLQRPVVIAAFTGWNDAGDAASNSVRHLVEAWQAVPLAEIDPEEFTDFATVRPHVRLDSAGARTIVWPTVGVWSASTPGGDVILVLGPEPALRWRLFTEQITGVAQRFAASRRAPHTHRAAHRHGHRPGHDRPLRSATQPLRGAHRNRRRAP